MRVSDEENSKFVEFQCARVYSSSKEKEILFSFLFVFAWDFIQASGEWELMLVVLTHVLDFPFRARFSVRSIIIERESFKNELEFVFYSTFRYEKVCLEEFICFDSVRYDELGCCNYFPLCTRVNNYFILILFERCFEWTFLRVRVRALTAKIKITWGTRCCGSVLWL